MASKNPDLTITQKAAAAELLAKRPMVYPGTRVIIETNRRKAWYDEVASEAVVQKITPAQSEAFFDACGVPD